MLRDHNDGNERVLTIEMVNPFPHALLVPPPQG